MNAYIVDIQPSNGYEFKNEIFSVNVGANGFNSAARRGLRRAAERAIEWNNENPDANMPRPVIEDHYRVVAVRHVDIDSPQISPRSGTASMHATPKGATLILAMDLETVLETLAAKNS